MAYRAGWIQTDVHRDRDQMIASGAGVTTADAGSGITIQKLLSGNAFDGYLKMDDRVIAINGCNILGLPAEEVLSLSKRCGDQITLTVHRRPADDYETRRLQRRRSRQPTSNMTETTQDPRGNNFHIASTDQNNIVVRSFNRSQSANPENDLRLSSTGSILPPRVNQQSSASGYGYIANHTGMKESDRQKVPFSPNSYSKTDSGTQFGQISSAYAPMHSSTVTVMPRYTSPSVERTQPQQQQQQQSQPRSRPATGGWNTSSSTYANSNAKGNNSNLSANPYSLNAIPYVSNENTNFSNKLPGNLGNGGPHASANAGDASLSQKYQFSPQKASDSIEIGRKATAPGAYQSAHMQHLSAIPNHVNASPMNNQTRSHPQASQANNNNGWINLGVAQSQQKRVISQSVVDLSKSGKSRPEEQNRLTSFATSASTKPSNVVYFTSSRAANSRTNDGDSVSLCDYSLVSPPTAGEPAINGARTHRIDPTITRLYQIVSKEQTSQQ